MLTNSAYLVLKISIILYLFVIIYLMVRYNKSMRKERRINKHTLKTKFTKTDSYGDTIVLALAQAVAYFSKRFNKSKIMKKLATRYEKYTSLFKSKFDPMDIISYKFVIIIILNFFVFFYKLMLNELITFGDIALVIAVVYLGVNAYLYYLYKRYNHRLQHQLLDAIILMNNAFEAGKSTLLALENVYHELDNEMGSEFRRVHIDVSKGLGIDEAFSRLANRTSIKEIEYIAASITVMHKSGGNIVKVFQRILKGYYARKKMEAEVSSILIVSKITMWILLVMPVVFGTIITLVNPAYFAPLFSTLLGNFILMIIVFMYTIYAYVINKIIKEVDVW